MTVKRYTPTQCCEHDGTYVTYSDYQKLLAENLALKNNIQVWAAHKEAFDAFDGDRRGIGEHLYEAELVLLRDFETPATDVAIAEIKSHDINLLIDKLSGLPFTIGVSCGYVKEFAANLRAGRNG